MASARSSCVGVEKTFLWSRGEELLAGRFPEVEQTAEFLPDGTVIDGELVAWRDGAPLPFSELQRRINRKTTGKKLLADVPCAMLAYDLLELGGCRPACRVDAGASHGTRGSWCMRCRLAAPCISRR